MFILVFLSNMHKSCTWKMMLLFCWFHFRQPALWRTVLNLLILQKAYQEVSLFHANSLLSSPVPKWHVRILFSDIISSTLKQFRLWMQQNCYTWPLFLTCQFLVLFFILSNELSVRYKQISNMTLNSTDYVNRFWRHIWCVDSDWFLIAVSLNCWLQDEGYVSKF